MGGFGGFLDELAEIVFGLETLAKGLKMRA